MKFSLKHFTLAHYIRHVRRQSKHVQHMHALGFAGIITVSIASIILYTDYGFWHETYRAEDLSVIDRPAFTPESPRESFASFLREAKERFGSIGTAGVDLFEGKETYIKDSQ